MGSWSYQLFCLGTIVGCVQREVSILVWNSCTVIEIHLLWSAEQRSFTKKLMQGFGEHLLEQWLSCQSSETSKSVSTNRIHVPWKGEMDVTCTYLILSLSLYPAELCPWASCARVITQIVCATQTWRLIIWTTCYLLLNVVPISVFNHLAILSTVNIGGRHCRSQPLSLQRQL